MKHEHILPLTEHIAALGIGIDELIALKAGINQAVKLNVYGYVLKVPLIQ